MFSPFIGQKPINKTRNPNYLQTSKKYHTLIMAIITYAWETVNESLQVSLLTSKYRPLTCKQGSNNYPSYNLKSFPNHKQYFSGLKPQSTSILNQENLFIMSFINSLPATLLHPSCQPLKSFPDMASRELFKIVVILPAFVCFPDC